MPRTYRRFPSNSMKKLLKTIICIVLLALIGTFSVSVAALPTQTDAFFVNDYADVISSETENKIYSQGENLYNACKAQAVVVTVDSLDGEPIEGYAYNLANEWALGDKDEDNGVLILLAVNDREVRIEVGSGLEGALPDSKTGRIIDTYGIEYFSRDDFSSGLASVYNSVVNEIYIEYGLEPDKNYKPVENGMSTAEIIISIIVVLIVVLSFFSRGGRGGIFFFPFFIGRGGYHGGYNGGYRGGGGFGGFSGGGGGFSGGGASRRF